MTSIVIAAEAISARAVEIGGLTCKSIAALITNHKAARPAAGPGAIIDHANLRGPGYFYQTRDKIMTRAQEDETIL